MSESLRCTYCRRYNDELDKLIAGPGVYICGDDVARAVAHLRVGDPDDKCAFCGRTQRAWVYAHQTVICDECLRTCVEIVEEDAEPTIPPTDDPVLATYMKQIEGHPRLSAEREAELWARARRGDSAAKGEIVQAHLREVLEVAQADLSSGRPLLDLIQEGNIGLMRAVETFDPAKGFRFGTYARWWIRQAIRSALVLGPSDAAAREEPPARRNRVPGACCSCSASPAGTRSMTLSFRVSERHPYPR